MTREYAIVQAIVAKLLAAGIVGTRVYECRGESLVDDGLPAIDVMPMETSPSEFGAGSTRNDFDIHVDIYAKADLDRSPVEVADPVVEAVHRALCAGDRTLGGLCAWIQAGQRRWNKAVADGTYIQVEQTFRVIHGTRATDIAIAV
jgi:hypothetical protein